MNTIMKKNLFKQRWEFVERQYLLIGKSRQYAVTMTEWEEYGSLASLFCNCFLLGVSDLGNIGQLSDDQAKELADALEWVVNSLPPKRKVNGLELFGNRKYEAECDLYIYWLETQFSVKRLVEFISFCHEGGFSVNRDWKEPYFIRLQ